MSTTPRPAESLIADFRHSSLSDRSVGLISKGEIHTDLGQRSGTWAFFPFRTVMFCKNDPTNGV